MIKYTKIKAGALQFVLFIGVVIALLLMAFILLSHLHTFFENKTNLYIHTLKQSDIGLEYAMNTPMPQSDTVNIDFEDPYKTELKGVKNYWGVFEKYAITASTKKNKFTRIALVGKPLSNDFSALYVKDNERPLIITGNSKITGNAFLPEQGIKSGNISGMSYPGRVLLYGKKRKSKREMPPLNKAAKSHILYLLNGGFNAPPNHVVDLSGLKDLKNSFHKKTKFIYGNTLNLEEISLTGNIIVKATDRIRISSSSILHDIILVAPIIEIENNVSGKFQAISSKYIKMGESCNLQYPSALVVYDRFKKAQSNGNPQSGLNINLGPRSKLSGAIMYLNENNEEQSFSSQIFIDSNTQIKGEVYCEKNLELKGDVIGNVTTNTFIALENGSVYLNHLYAGTINSLELPKKYAGILYENEDSEKLICKWLY